MGYLVKHVVLPVFIAINSALAYRCLFDEEAAVQDILEYWAPGRDLHYHPLTDLEKHLVHIMGSACLCFLLTEVAAIALDNSTYQTMTLAFQTLFFIIDGCSYFKMGREMAETPLAHAVGLGIIALGVHHMEMDLFGFGEVAAPTPDEKKTMLQAETTKEKNATAAAVPAAAASAIINTKNEPSKSKSPKKKKKIKNGINNSNGLSNTAPNGQKMPSLIVEKDMEKTKSINGTTTASMSKNGPSSDKKMPAAAAATAPTFIDEKKDEMDVPALIIDDAIKSSSESSVFSTEKAF